MNRRDSLRWTIGMLALGHLSAARSHTGVTVGVRQVPRADGSMQYAYHIDNGGSQPVVALLLGHNHPHGVSELTTYPRGWTPGSAAGTASPPGWRVEVITTEDNGYAEIEWRNKGADVRPGKRLDGFAVVLDEPNDAYADGRWTAVLADGSTASGQLSSEGAARVAVSIGTVEWGAPDQRYVQLVFANPGTGGSLLTLTRLGVRTLAGFGSASIVAPVAPLELFYLDPGQARALTLHLTVPDTVRKLALSQAGTVRAGQRTAQFATSQMLLAK